MDAKQKSFKENYTNTITTEYNDWIYKYIFLITVKITRGCCFLMSQFGPPAG